MHEFSTASYALVSGPRTHMQPLIYIVRHGTTDLNSENRYRGWADVALDADGIKDAETAKQYLKDIDFAVAYSSDLKRAKKTRNIIIGTRGTPSQELRGMRPWHIGQLTGQVKNDANRARIKHYADNPDEVIPDGESLNQFRSRYHDAFASIVPEAEKNVSKGLGPSLMTQHASTCQEVSYILYDDIEILDVEPGGIIVVFRKNGQLGAKVILGSEDGKERPRDYAS